MVLDVDAGGDDARALLHAVACPAVDLRLVTCVGGDAGLDDVAGTTAVPTVVAPTGS